MPQNNVASNLKEIQASYSSLKAIEKGNMKEITTAFKEVETQLKEARQIENVPIFGLVDALGINDEWRANFSRAFTVAMFGKKDSNFFNKYDEDTIKDNQKKLNFDVTATQTGGGLNPVGPASIGTDIIPTLESLVADTGILSEIQIIEADSQNMNNQLYDFNDDSLENASNLSETAPGTDVDTTLRRGDLLTPNNKLQRSTVISNLALASFNAVEYGVFMARIVRSVRKLLITNMLYGGVGAANGTAKNGVRGIKNNFGINGTGDNANFIGAISYANKAAADAAIVSFGGSASVDPYDLCLKVKDSTLPNWLSVEEEEKYVYLMSRRTWGVIKNVTDLNGRYKARHAFDPATGKVVREIDGLEVKIVPQVAQGEVFLVPLSYYRYITKGGLLSANDGGLIGIREGRTVFVSRIYADGSLQYGHKYTSTTAATIGTTPVNNQDQNLWRTFFIS